ncbi:MAG: chemotaxis protein CheB [Euryarchaeota archaeon]|nr:chemotaxis protein CheB [Euryarchaeota archaeon]
MTTDRPHVGVVCFGSSAGGLRSLQAVFSGLSSDFSWAILITQHFPSDVRSYLAEILTRGSALSVREAVEGDILDAGVALTCPSDVEMGVAADRTIAFRPRVPGPPESVDFLFKTAAVAAGPSVVAVVLSGMGSDGAAGTVIVKKNGGVVLVERPQTAEWGGMPTAAIRAGPVDGVLESPDIAPVLTGLVRAPRGESGGRQG